MPDGLWQDEDGISIVAELETEFILTLNRTGGVADSAEFLARCPDELKSDLVRSLNMARVLWAYHNPRGNSAHKGHARIFDFLPVTNVPPGPHRTRRFLVRLGKLTLLYLGLAFLGGLAVIFVYMLREAAKWHW